MGEKIRFNAERDQKILDLTIDLCQRLDIPDYKPIGIYWWGMVPTGKNRWDPFPPDQCKLTKDHVTLSDAMMNELEPEEWSSIIASELIYNKKLRFRVLLGFLLGASVPIAVYVAEFISLPGLFPQLYTATNTYGIIRTSSIGSFVALITGILLTPTGTLIIGFTWAKRVRLQADRFSARILGTASLLVVLDKIALRDSKRTWRRRGEKRGNTVPSLERRIANLRKQPETPKQ